MIKRIYIIIFMMCISIPLVGMLWYKTDMGVEKRYAKKFPDLFKEGGLNTAYFEEFEDYVSDHFAYRQELSTADAVIKSRIFGVSNNDKVIVGRQGWLYFGETIKDYIGRNTLSKRGIHNCARVLALLQEGAEQQECSFVFAAAPNKNTLYPQYMPKRYIRESRENNLCLLQKELITQQVSFVDLQAAFGAKEDEVMYHRLDTHWNNQGAAFACDIILNRLGKEHTDYTQIPWHTEQNFPADLWGMLYPKWDRRDEDIVFGKTHDFVFENPGSSAEDMHIATSCGDKQGTLLVYRDSFGNALLPFLADEYGQAYFTKAVPYDWGLISSKEADAVVIELAERHIGELQREIPVMWAPEREKPEKITELTDTETTLQMKRQGESYIIFGEVDAGYTADTSDIYIHISNERGEGSYEAFPAAFALSGQAGNEDYQYGMYLPADRLENVESIIEVMTEKNGCYYVLGKFTVKGESQK